MIKKAIFLLTTAMTLLLAGCTKENRKTTIERQWVGEIVIDNNVEPVSFCLDINKTSEGNMILAINGGDLKNNMLGGAGNIDWGDVDLGNLGDLSDIEELMEFLTLLSSLNDEDYIYSDYSTVSYTLTYTGKDTGTITFKDPGLSGGNITVDFKDLTNTSVTISFNGEAIELTATVKELKKISDTFFLQSVLLIAASWRKGF